MSRFFTEAPPMSMSSSLSEPDSSFDESGFTELNVERKLSGVSTPSGTASAGAGTAAGSGSSLISALRSKDEEVRQTLLACLPQHAQHRSVRHLQALVQGNTVVQAIIRGVRYRRGAPRGLAVDI